MSQAFGSCTRDAAVRFRSELAFLAQPARQRVPTRENLGHHLTASLHSVFRSRIPPSPRCLQNPVPPGSNRAVLRRRAEMHVPQRRRQIAMAREFLNGLRRGPRIARCERVPQNVRPRPSQVRPPHRPRQGFAQRALGHRLAALTVEHALTRQMPMSTKRLLQSRRHRHLPQAPALRGLVPSAPSTAAH